MQVRLYGIEWRNGLENVSLDLETLETNRWGGNIETTLMNMFRKHLSPSRGSLKPTEGGVVKRTRRIIYGVDDFLYSQTTVFYGSQNALKNAYSYHCFMLTLRGDVRHHRSHRFAASISPISALARRSSHLCTG